MQTYHHPSYSLFALMFARSPFISFGDRPSLSTDSLDQSGLVTSPPSIEHEPFADAMSELGTNITQIKKFAENGTFVSPNISVNFKNTFAVCVCGFPEENPFSGPIYLTKIRTCHHKSFT
jgi:hypothetical protein